MSKVGLHSKSTLLFDRKVICKNNRWILKERYSIKRPTRPYWTKTTLSAGRRRATCKYKWYQPISVKVYTYEIIKEKSALKTLQNVIFVFSKIVNGPRVWGVCSRPRLLTQINFLIYNQFKSMVYLALMGVIKCVVKLELCQFLSNLGMLYDFWIRSLSLFHCLNTVHETSFIHNPTPSLENEKFSIFQHSYISPKIN